MILSVVFLWGILGWRYHRCIIPLTFELKYSSFSSALLSVLTMTLGVPILAFISRMLLSTQKKRMRSVSYAHIVWLPDAYLSIRQMNAWIRLHRVRQHHFERHEFSIISHAALNNIRTIKLFAWEPKVKSQIDGRRTKELKLIRKGKPSAATVHNITYTRRPYDRNSRIYCTVAVARFDDGLHLCHLCKIVRPA